MTHTVRIALPSKGALGDSTLDFLAACGLPVHKPNPRQYTATIPNLPDVWVVFQRPADIPVSVSRGDVDLGITGADRVAELDAPARAPILALHDALDYARCELVVAVPAAWTDVTSMAALAARAQTTDGLRAATKYKNLTGAFLKAHHVAPCELVYADGALEVAPAVGSADFIADISATGTTLRENALKPVPDGTILQAQAGFIGNYKALKTRAAVHDVARKMLEYIEAHLCARERMMVTANIRGASAEAVAARVLAQSNLGGLTGPTLAQVFSRSPDESWFAVNLVVTRDRLYPAIGQLRAIGGSGVIVTPVNYIFDEYPERCRALDAALNGGAES
ncbi:MAG: ATP phosphoribosyltransferase [Anaerolineae bacterium]|nr:ATP phosphoribosyltransferase [Anaerolineae bacterium]